MEDDRAGMARTVLGVFSKKRVWNVVKLSLFLAILGLLASYARFQWSKLPPLQAPDPTWLLTAWFCGLCGCSILPFLLKRLLSLHGIRVSYRKAVGLYFIPSQGKYVPGKVWSLLWAAAAYQRQGADWPTAFACTIVMTGVHLISALMVAFLLGMTALGVSSAWLFLGLFGLLAIHPSFFYGVINTALTRVKREPVNTRLSGFELVRLLGLNSLYWCFIGVGFLCVSYSFFGHSPGFFATASAQSLACATGMLAFFTPAGLGVREGAMAFFLTPVIGAGIALALSALQRLWQLWLEVPLALLGWYFLEKRTDTTAPNQDIIDNL